MNGTTPLYFLYVFQSEMASTAMIPVSQLHQRYTTAGFPEQLFPQYIQLLKRFEIAIEMHMGKRFVTRLYPGT